MKRNPIATTYMLLFLASACCLHRISLESFERSSLPSKVEQYEEAISENCVYSERLALLDAMATHGDDAAVAMTNLLERPSANFPLQDVMKVLEYVHFGGYDLRSHRAMAALKRLAEQSSDPQARSAAMKTMEAIDKFDPTKRGP